jgi:hypothetical protein
MYKIAQDENGKWFAIAEDGYSTSQNFARLDKLEDAINTEKRLAQEQGITHPDIVPEGSPLEWSY